MAQNSNRGSVSMNEQQRQEIAGKGGRSSGDRNSNSQNTGNRGLASADQKTRERVAKEGGRASHGGGRK